MQFEECNRLLDPRPMPLEMGFERLPGGALHVAIRTDMHGCTGAMFEWWFRFRPSTREYVWWHPLDHIFSDWTEAEPDTHVGSIHKVIERFTGGDPEHLSIQFRPPEEFFAAPDLDAARAEGRISGLVCARGGLGHSPQRTPDGAVIGTRLAHVCRDTPWGMVLRSHFFLGHDLPGLGVPAAQMNAMFPDAAGAALLQHCYDEFTFLSRLLPSLHVAEQTDRSGIVRPW